MKIRYVSFLALFILTTGLLTPAVVRAEETEEYRYVTAVLKQRLTALELALIQCGTGTVSALNRGEELLDRAERRMNSDPRGDLTTKERAALTQTKRDIDDHIDAMQPCHERVRAERSKVQTTLSRPELIRAEADKVRGERQRLGEGLRQQLQALLNNARGASDLILTGGGTYDAFVLRLQAVGEQIQSIKSNYALPLQFGDHKSLAGTVSNVCNALYLAGAEWKKERQAAAGLATAQENAEKYRNMSHPSVMDLAYLAKSEETLRRAQQAYDQAQKRLMDQKSVVAGLVAEGAKVAKDDGAK